MAEVKKLYADDGREIVLKTNHLCIQFGGLKAVDDVNLEIKKGELYGLIGPNGAGKTTVFNLLTGVYKPTSGRFYLCGEDITGKAPAEVNKKGIARTFQNIRLFNNLTVIENVMVGLANQIPCSIPESIIRLPRHKRSEREFEARALELLEVFGLAEYKDYLAANLPYGKQRKLEIARAMATNPKLLLLDDRLDLKLEERILGVTLDKSEVLRNGRVEDKSTERCVDELGLLLAVDLLSYTDLDRSVESECAVGISHHCLV